MLLAVRKRDSLPLVSCGVVEIPGSSWVTNLNGQHEQACVGVNAMDDVNDDTPQRSSVDK